MFEMKRFAEFLTDKRKKRGLTQEQLSDMIGVTHQAVSKWERGEAMPEISKIGDLAKAIGVSVNDIISNMYDGEKIIEEQPTMQNNADAKYFSLPDKTDVGAVYSLAPNLSKETLRSAIDCIISEKGTRAASMLFKFADEEYLRKKAEPLLSRGDFSLVEYADQNTIKRQVINLVTEADLSPERNILLQYYRRAGEILIHCKDEEFINETFEHTVEATGNWNVWKHIINKFPPNVLVKQGTKYMIANGTSSFCSWWNIIGRRVVSRMFIGYADHFNNNAQAWKDIAYYYEYADQAIMASAIKERLKKCNPEVFSPLLSKLDLKTKEMLKEMGVKESYKQKAKKNKFNWFGQNYNLDFVKDILLDGVDLNEIIELFENRLDEISERLDAIEEKLDQRIEYNEQIDEIKSIFNELNDKFNPDNK